VAKLSDILELVVFTNTAVVVCDTQGKVLYISPKFDSEFNHFFKLEIKKDVSNILLNTDDFPDFLNLISTNATNYSVFKTQTSQINKLDICAKQMKLRDGTEIIFFAINEDIGSRRSTNKDSMALEKIVKATSSAGIGTWEYIPEKKLAFFSPKMKELLGVAQSEFLDWDQFKSLIVDIDQIIFDEFFTNHIESGIALDFEFRVRIESKIRWFALKGEVFVNDDLESTIVGSIEDSTYKKKVLMQLSNANDAKKLALEAGNIGTWKGMKRSTGFWSWEWDSMIDQMFQFGDKMSTKLGKWKERIHPDDVELIVDTLNTAILTDCPFDLDFRVCIPGQDEKYIHAQGTVVKSINKHIKKIYGVCIDQTETVKYREELEKLNTELENRVVQRTSELESVSDRAEQANQAKSNFLAMMSHELRTPMNAIIGNLELASNDKLKQETRSLIETSKVAADNLVSILNDILDINKIESGKLELEEAPFSISDIIDNIISIFLPVASKKNIIIDVREDTKIPKLVIGDEIRVRQILFNLLGNAIKFTSSNNDKIGKIVVDVFVAEKTLGFYNIVFSIKDNGIGIEKQVQHSLFSPFVQAEKSTTRKYGGTGLGLAICGKLADMMGGHISMESEIGSGSNFSLHLPIWQEKAEKLPAPKLQNKKIIIVNVNKYLKKVSQRYICYLEQEGVSVEFIDTEDLVAVPELSKPQDVDLILVMVGEVEFGKNIIAATETSLLRNKVVVAIDREAIDPFILTYPLINYLPIKPLTRSQLITALINVLTNELTPEQDNDSKTYTNTEQNTVIEPQLNVDLNNPVNTDILIVEDNVFNQELIKKQMTRLGFNVDLANDGKEAITLWQKNNYQLILSDCHMPEMDGYEMTKAIRNLEKNSAAEPIPIIAITGAAMSGDKEHCLSVGMNDFLSKPIKLNDLKVILNKWYTNPEETIT